MAESDHKGETVDCQFVGEPNGTYRQNCAAGYQPDWPRLWQAHHILPCGAVRDGHISGDADDIAYIRKCLCLTDWDINMRENLIGLDTKVIYNFYPVMPFPLPDNFPSHLVDHDLYSEESYKYMENNVWDTLHINRKVHKLEAKPIEAELNAARDYLKTKVYYRGLREGGSAWCFKNRFNDGMEDKWYYPLSMAETPRKRDPGISNKWPWLDTLFDVIK
jgi:hypothetical protein